MTLTPDQFERLMALLEKSAAVQTYTITGAADWPIAAFIVAGMAALLGFMWRDLRSVIRDNKTQWQKDLAEHKEENKEQFDYVWTAIRDCQHECCPRKKE